MNSLRHRKNLLLTYLILAAAPCLITKYSWAQAEAGYVEISLGPTPVTTTVSRETLVAGFQSGAFSRAVLTQFLPAFQGIGHDTLAQYIKQGALDPIIPPLNRQVQAARNLLKNGLPPKSFPSPLVLFKSSLREEQRDMRKERGRLMSLAFSGKTKLEDLHDVIRLLREDRIKNRLWLDKRDVLATERAVHAASQRIADAKGEIITRAEQTAKANFESYRADDTPASEIHEQRKPAVVPVRLTRLSPNLKTLVVSDEQGAPVAKIQTGSMILTQFITRDGKYIATESEDGAVQLWDAVKGYEKRKSRWHKNSIKLVAPNPEGDKILIIKKDNTIHEWDIATGEVVNRGATWMDPEQIKSVSGIPQNLAAPLEPGPEVSETDEDSR